MPHLDKLLRHCTVLAGGESVCAIQNGYVAIEAGCIQAIGALEDLPPCVADEVHELEGHLVIPGLIDAGTSILPPSSRESPSLTSEEAPSTAAMEEHLSSACRRMIWSGTTAFCHLGACPDIVARVATKLGMRVCVSVEPRHLETMRADWDGNDLVRIALRLPPPHRCTDAELQSMAETVSRSELRILLPDLASTSAAAADLPLELDRLQAAGLLSDRLLCALPLSLPDRERKMLSAARVNILHCPHQDFRNGALPTISALHSEGTPVCLGSGCAEDGTGNHMFQVLRWAAMLHKAATQNPTVFPAEDVFQMATTNGATALGWGDAAGNLVPGKAADLTVIDLRAPHLTPVYDCLSHLVYAVRPADVSGTMVRGRWLAPRDPIGAPGNDNGNT